MLDGVTHATRTVLRTLMLAVLLSGAHAVVAQDGLYAPVLPGDTAFVRVMNVSTEAVSIDLGPVRIGPVEPGSGSDYHGVRPGVYVVFAGGTRVPVTSSPQSFQTVVMTRDTAEVIEDPYHDDPLRSQLLVYNATSGAVRVDAIEPESPLFESVPPGESGSLVLNAIRVLLRSTLADGQRFDTEVQLSRGDSYALTVTGTGVFVVKAAVRNPAD